MADQGRSDFSVAFTINLCALEFKIEVNKIAISAHMALKLGRHVLKSYLKITCEFQLRILLIKKLVPQRITVKTT